MEGGRPIHPWILVSVFLVLSASCSERSQWTGSVGVRDGIEVISNPGTPLLGDSRDVITELWTFQGPDWEDPSLVHVRTGLVTVVDPPANRVHLLSTSGEAGASLGRSGAGPGEFLRLLDAIPEGDSLMVLDSGKGSVEYLDLAGAYLSSLHLKGQPWAGFPLRNGSLLVKGEFLSDPAQESFGDWVIVRQGVDPKAFTTHRFDQLPEEEGVQCSDLSPWGEGVARLRYTTPRIHLFDEAGTLLQETWIDLPVEPISESERAAALADLRESSAARGLPPEFIQQSLAVMEERWRVKCRFGPLRFDRSTGLAAILEQNPDEFGSGSATLHFLSEDGIYLARTGFSTAWRDFAMDAGRVYALSRDPTTDVVTLKAFRVDLPDALFSVASEALEGARQLGAEGSIPRDGMAR